MHLHNILRAGDMKNILIVETWWHHLVVALGNLGETCLSNLCLKPCGEKKETWGKFASSQPSVGTFDQPLS